MVILGVVLMGLLTMPLISLLDANLSALILGGHLLLCRVRHVLEKKKERLNIEEK